MESDDKRVNAKQKSVGVFVFLFAIIFGPIIYLHKSDRVHGLAASDTDLITALSSRYQVIDLGTLPGYNWCEANGINDKGQVLCTAGIRKGYDSWIGTTRAFCWESGRQRDLGMLKSYPLSKGVAINSQGQILGITSLSDAKSASTRIFLWRNGVMQELGILSLPGRKPNALSDQGDIVGEAFPQMATEAKTAFLWKAGKGRYLG